MQHPLLLALEKLNLKTRLMLISPSKNFEEVPIIGKTEAEGEERVNAQLMNPLGWWKVSNLLVEPESSSVS